MADTYKLQEDHGEYFSVSKARTLMENASKDEDLQNHVKNMEKYDIFVCIIYISDGIHSGTCKKKHIIIYNTDTDNKNVVGVLSCKKDCVKIIPITTSKTNADTKYQKYKIPFINKTGTNLSLKKDLYINLGNLRDYTLGKDKIFTTSRCEIIGYVGKLRIEDIRNINTYRLRWIAEKSEGDKNENSEY